MLSKEVGPCSNRHVPFWQTPNVTLSTAAHSPSWRGLQRLHSADDVATAWLKACGSMHSTITTTMSHVQISLTIDQFSTKPRFSWCAVNVFEGHKACEVTSWLFIYSVVRWCPLITEWLATISSSTWSRVPYTAEIGGWWVKQCWPVQHRSSEQNSTQLSSVPTSGWSRAVTSDLYRFVETVIFLYFVVLLIALSYLCASCLLPAFDVA